MNLHRGQGLELLWRDSLQCPTEEEYIAMVNNSEYLILRCRHVEDFAHFPQGWKCAAFRTMAFPRSTKPPPLPTHSVVVNI